MGSAVSRHDDLSTNNYLLKLAGKEFVPPNDSFWNEFLTFSFSPPMTVSEHQVLDDKVSVPCQLFLANNLYSGNFGSLIQVFLGYTSEILASNQTENNVNIWRAYNSLFVLRNAVKYFIESLKEEDVLREFEARPEGCEPDSNSTSNSTLESFLESLIEVVVDIPVRDFTYPLHMEAINTLIVLLSVHMYSQKPASNSCVFRNLMHGRASIHAPLLVKTLLHHFVEQTKAPAGYYKNSAGGSLVIGLAAEIWNMLTFGMSRNVSTDGTINGVNGNHIVIEEQLVSEAPLANQSLLLILILTNHCTGDKNFHNPYREALFSCTNSQAVSEEDGNLPTQAPSTFKMDFSKLFNSLCQGPSSDQMTLLLYLLVHRNQYFRTYVLSRTDIQLLIIPILKTLYNAPDTSSLHIYMSLIILLILSEYAVFNYRVHETMLKGVTWYTERAISEISLGGLLVLVVIRTIQYNMLKMRDKYLHTNCLAALANMSSHFSQLHPYVSQRLVSLFETLAKKHARLLKQVKEENMNRSAEDGESELNRDLVVLEEVLQMVLEIINSCLSHQLADNPNLIYTLLYKKQIFEPYRNHQTFQEIIHNMDTVILFFSNKLDQIPDIGVNEVLSTIQQGAKQWPKDRLKKFPDLKFKYVEEDRPENFFIPYVWSLVVQFSSLYWDQTNAKLMVSENMEG